MRTVWIRHNPDYQPDINLPIYTSVFSQVSKTDVIHMSWIFAPPTFRWGAWYPKCQASPFFVWCTSGSRWCAKFFVEDGAAMIVESTIVPFLRINSCSEFSCMTLLRVFVVNCFWSTMRGISQSYPHNLIAWIYCAKIRLSWFPS